MADDGVDFDVGVFEFAGAGCIGAGPGCCLKIGSYPRHSLLLFWQLRHVGWASSH